MSSCLRCDTSLRGRRLWFYHPLGLPMNGTKKISVDLVIFFQNDSVPSIKIDGWGYKEVLFSWGVILKLWTYSYSSRLVPQGRGQSLAYSRLQCMLIMSCQIQFRVADCYSKDPGLQIHFWCSNAECSISKSRWWVWRQRHCLVANQVLLLRTA